MIRRDRVQNEVEAARVLLHLVRVLRNHHLVRAEPQRIVLLVRRSREDHHVCAPSACANFTAMWPSPPRPDHANLLALRHAPVPHRRVRRDPRAQQRRRPRQVKVRRHPQHKSLVHHDAVRVAAIRHAAHMLVGKVISQRRDSDRTAPARPCTPGTSDPNPPCSPPRPGRPA